MRHVILRDVKFIVNAWKTTSVNDYESLTQTMQFKIQPTEEILIEKEKKIERDHKTQIDLMSNTRY